MTPGVTVTVKSIIAVIAIAAITVIAIAAVAAITVIAGPGGVTVIFQVLVA